MFFHDFIVYHFWILEIIFVIWDSVPVSFFFWETVTLRKNNLQFREMLTIVKWDRDRDRDRDRERKRQRDRERKSERETETMV